MELYEGEGSDSAQNELAGYLVVEAPSNASLGDVVVEIFHEDTWQVRAWRKNNGTPLTARIEGESRDSAPIASEAQLATEEKALDIVVVVDGTHSMRQRGLLPRVQAAVEGFLSDMWKEHQSPQAGMIIFGDALWGDRIVRLRFTSDQAEILDRLERLPSYAYSGGDEPESVLEALREAAYLSASGRWGARKVVLLFTDAPPRCDDLMPEDVAKELNHAGASLAIFAPYSPDCQEVYDALRTDAQVLMYRDIYRRLEEGLNELMTALL
jgi:hypothetical protein